MTRPTLPGLVARWREMPLRNDDEGNPDYDADEAYIFMQCAAELSQAVALTGDEVDALANMDARRLDDTRKGWFLAHAETYDTLRALVTRLTAASDGGGKGEG